MNLRSTVFSILVLSVPITAGSQVISESNWSSYRGNLSSGVLDDAGLPDKFSVDKMTNILWKIPVPGLGMSSPVIWGDRIFITTAVSKNDKSGFKPGIYGDVSPVNDSSEHEWRVICIERKDGKVLWSRTAYTGIPAIKRHPKSTHANSSAATDGSHVVAFFGSEGLYCYDIDGKLLWKKQFGILKSVFFSMKDAEWEFASSPIIFDGKVIIQCDVLENSFLAAFDVASGRELWKKDRDEYPGWCTPAIYDDNGRHCIAVNGYKHRGGYDLQTGEELWRMSGGGDIPIPTPVTGNGMIYFNSAHGRSSPILAVASNARGDITLKENETSNEFVKWSLPRGGSYMHTMLLYRNRLYSVDWNGTLTCYDPLDGKKIYSAKLGKARSFVASPVAADGKIYVVDEEGIVYIVEAGDTFMLLSEIRLGDVSLTAPALAKGMIVFRTHKFLIAAGKK